MYDVNVGSEMSRIFGNENKKGATGTGKRNKAEVLVPKLEFGNENKNSVRSAK